LTLLLPAACTASAASPGPDPSAAHPPISIAEAKQIVNQYDLANNAANARFDLGAVQKAEAPPAQLTSVARLTQAKVLHQTVPAVTHPPEQIVIPLTTGYPRWFVAVAPVVSAGAATPRPKYVLFAQDAANGPWRVAYYPYPADDSTMIPLATNAEGGSPLVTNAAGLAADPAALNQAIYDYYQNNGSETVRFASSTALDKQLTSGYKLGQQQMQSRGVTFVRTYETIRYPSYLLRTLDGGVLAFTANGVRDTLTAKAGRKVTLDPGTHEAVMAGKPGGASAHQFTEHRLQMFLTYIPRAGTAAAAQVLAYDDEVVAVN
jgi:hypothetical protein